MLEIDGRLINLRNVLFAQPEEKGQTKITFVDGRAITVYIDYKVVKMAICKYFAQMQ
tara:strand:+ start:244 stop:414 length:171 start_codon:yes stop_codon:yes gene_type:complete